jgi:hypothetical protein
MALLWLKPLAAQTVRASEGAASSTATVTAAPIKARGVA